MALATLGLNFLNLLILANSQHCSKPPIMNDYNIASYGQGTWFTHSIMSTLETPLNYFCSRGITSNNGTHFFMKLLGRKKGILETLGVVAERKTQSIHQWNLDYYYYRGMDLYDLNFDYYVIYHDKNIACVYISGKVMQYLAVRIVIIQSRKTTLDDSNYQKALEKFEPCRLNNEGWLKINHKDPVCKKM